jgi:2'-hydroxyisoflavone reductase
VKKLLILGGTRFIGRNLVHRLLQEERYDITLFNRQQSGSGLFPKTKRIKGYRNTNDVAQIKEHEWDLVVDLSCFFPLQLRTTLQSLVKPPDKYVLISTCSVYDNAEDRTILRKEDAAILTCTHEQEIDAGVQTYGRRKSECERVLRASGFPHVIFRPALVYGPYDPTDRFYYWLHQVRTQNRLLLPDNGERRFSTTFVGDLVEAIVRSLGSDHISGTFNVTSTPFTRITDIVDICMDELGSTPERVSAGPSFLAAQEIREWIDLPLWLNCDHFTYSNERMRHIINVAPTSLRAGIQHTIRTVQQDNWPTPTYGMSEDRRNSLLGFIDAGR